MKVLRISGAGIEPAPHKDVAGRLYFTAGRQGKGEWEYRIPLPAGLRPVVVPALEPRPEEREPGFCGFPGVCPRCGHRGHILFTGQVVPCPECQRRSEYVYSDRDFCLVRLDGVDPKGQPRYGLRPGVPDGTYLLIGDVRPGLRGIVEYRVEGSARVIAQGKIGEGLAGRAGCAPAPVIHVTGPCRIEWVRHGGKVYFEPSSRAVAFDGSEWKEVP